MGHASARRYQDCRSQPRRARRLPDTPTAHRSFRLPPPIPRGAASLHRIAFLLDSPRRCNQHTRACDKHPTPKYRTLSPYTHNAARCGAWPPRAPKRQLNSVRPPRLSCTKAAAHKRPSSARLCCCRYFVKGSSFSRTYSSCHCWLAENGKSANHSNTLKLLRVMLSCPNARQQSRRTRRGLAFSQRGCENARACPRIPRRQQGAQHNTRNQRSRARVSSARICSPPTRTHINMRRPLRAHIHSVRPKENTHARTSQREGSIPQPEKSPTTRDVRPPRERELCDSL